MAIFDYEENSSEKIGVVESVDTSNIVIKVENEEKLKKMQVNQLVVIQSSRIGQHLIGLVNKIMRNSSIDSIDEENKPVYSVQNVVKATLFYISCFNIVKRCFIGRKTLLYRS